MKARKARILADKEFMTALKVLYNEVFRITEEQKKEMWDWILTDAPQAFFDGQKEIYRDWVKICERFDNDPEYRKYLDEKYA